MQLIGDTVFSISRSRRPTISPAFQAQHLVHVTYDSESGRFLGLPPEWADILREDDGPGRWSLLLDEPGSRRSEEFRRNSFNGNDSSTALGRTSWRLTQSSLAETFISDISRYRKPPDIPTTEGTNVVHGLDTPPRLPPRINIDPPSSSPPFKGRPLPRPPTCTP